MKQHPFALGLSVMAMCAATPVWAASANNAAGIDAHLQSENMLSHFGPVAGVSHANPGPYDKTITVAKIKENAPIATGTLPPNFFIDAAGLTSEVKGSGIEVDAHYTLSNSSVNRATLTVNINPPPGMEIPIPYPALLVESAGIISHANFNTIAAGPTNATGSSSVHTLNISGSVLSAPVTYSGAAAPNTVIYDSPTVTITLNKQVEEGVISCSPDCGFTPSNITVTAVDISLHRAVMDGRKISGDIALGRAKAS
jgi:hypothetical protein